MSLSADLILHNANVITMDPARPRAGLVAVRGDRVCLVGTEADLEGLRRPGARVIDGGGATLLPGFHDAHLHFFSLASSLLEVDCGPPQAASIPDLLARLGERARAIPPGQWLRARGYHEFHLRERRHPTRWELDRAAPHHPVCLAHRSLHACVLNSRALALAGIAREKADPGVGYVERDQDGEPTGLLLEAGPYLGDVMPSPTPEEEQEGVRRACRLLLSSGVTSIQDAGSANDLGRWRAFSRLKERGDLPLRVAMMVGVRAMAEFLEVGLGPGSGDEGLYLGPAKVMQDETGSALSPGPGELLELVLRGHRAGFQVAIHAVEERAVAAALAALEQALAQEPRPGHRHRIEHCSECPPPLLGRLQRLGAVVVSQPPFIYYSGERYRAQVPAPQQPWLYRLGSFLKAGLGPAASSDAPVAGPAPLVGVYAAVARRSAEGGVLTPEEAVTPEQALWMYTQGAARSVFREDMLGSLAPGKLADMALLSGDPTRVPAEEILGLRVERTFIGGRLVWEG